MYLKKASAFSDQRLVFSKLPFQFKKQGFLKVLLKTSPLRKWEYVVGHMFPVSSVALLLATVPNALPSFSFPLPKVVVNLPASSSPGLACSPSAVHLGSITLHSAVIILKVQLQTCISNPQDLDRGADSWASPQKPWRCTPSLSIKKPADNPNAHSCLRTTAPGGLLWRRLQQLLTIPNWSSSLSLPQKLKDTPPHRNSFWRLRCCPPSGLPQLLK